MYTHSVNKLSHPSVLDCAYCNRHATHVLTHTTKGRGHYSVRNEYLCPEHVKSANVIILGYGKAHRK